MQKIHAAGAAVLSLAFVGSIAAGMAMAGDDAGKQTVASSSPSKGASESSLKQAADGYYAAMIKGNVLGMTAYYPAECQDDAGGLMLGSEMFKQIFDGVTAVHATKVRVEGTRGEVIDGKVEGKVSDATKRLFEDDTSGADDPDVWQYTNGKWFTTCDATFATASPAPTT